MLFRSHLNIILKLEGHSEVTNDPQDPGGLTKWGISQRAFPEIDIKKLTKSDAEKNYRKNYWNKLACDEVHPAIALCLFDCGVNQGVRTAVILAQDVLRLKKDGKLGPKTLSKLKRARPRIFAQNFLTARALKYSKLSTFKRFGKGWIRRLFVISSNASKIIEEYNFRNI